MKKETILKPMMLAILMMLALGANAQTKWRYTYDAKGNLTQRTITTGSSAREKSSSSIDLFPDGKIKAILEGGHNRLKIETLGYQNADIIIYDLSGMEMISRHANSEITTIDLNILRRGTYILTVEVDNEKKTCKFNK